MKKVKKVYGVYNIVEWVAMIKVGKATVKVRFAGGAMTTNGVTPAKFTTTDPVVQLAIERSEHYRNGKIRHIKSYPTNEEMAVERNVRKADSEDEKVMTDGGEPAGEESVASEEAEASVEAEVPTETDGEDKKSSALGELEFDNNDDARDYLETTFGFVRSKLKTRADIVAAGKVHGVSVNFSR